MKGTFPPIPRFAPRCKTPGCTEPARFVQWASSGFGRRCGNCNQRWRRQGDARQAPIRKQTELATYIKRIKQLLKRAANIERVETYLHDVAHGIEGAARSLEAVEVGKPWAHRWRQRAVDEMLRVLGDTNAVESGILVAAVFLMQDQDRHKFVSDRAFDFQLVRLWRSQTTLAFGSSYSHTTGKMSGYYRDLPPRVVEEIVPCLKTAYARFASRVISLFHTAQTPDEAVTPMLRYCPSPPCQNPIPLTKRVDTKFCSRRCKNREWWRRWRRKPT